MAAQLPEVARSLLDPQTYPERPDKVELVQTQMSFVFLAGKYAYKIKKPVNLGYLDYSTLEKRHFFCRQELKLNRRLCASAYLEVVPIFRGPAGISFHGTGEPVEFAVKMLRLPAERMMPALLEQDRVTGEMVAALARKLYDFHAQAETNPQISAFGSLDSIRLNTAENFTQTEKYVGRTLTASQFQRIKDYTTNFLENQASLFNERVTQGRIRDCHGDLHAQHICFTGDICILDCIEFNDRFRYCDVASEIAFLAMDLDHYGRADLSRIFSRDYIEFSRDSRSKDLLKFYKGYRADIRGKVASFKWEDPYVSEAERAAALDEARSYFELAVMYARSRPVLFITVGLVGSGKTTVARALARRLGLTVISSDVVRKNLASVPLTEHRFVSPGSGIYSSDFSRQTYDALFAAARPILEGGDSVILDASFSKVSERQTARQVAEAAGADFFILECRLDESNTRERLAERLKNKSAVSDGRWEIFEAQKKSFDPVAEVPSDRHFIIDSSLPLPDRIKDIVERV